MKYHRESETSNKTMNETHRQRAGSKRTDVIQIK